jgi:hypothetical protein|tara:strand:- start:1778 stop:1906 length:129 start_codon:yes stop_codon:yes gene_type:complete
MGEGDFFDKECRKRISHPLLLSSFNLSFPFEMDRDYRIKPSN